MHDAKRKRRFHLWILVLILLTSLVTRYRGIDWPSDLHLDELKIKRWMDYSVEHGALRHSYAGGFFTMHRGLNRCLQACMNIRDQWRYWRGEIARVVPPPIDNIALARRLNVWLGAMTCLLVYFLVKGISNSTPGGLFGAALFCFAQYHVEHCHYAETDIAMVFMLSLSLWLWVRFANTRRLAVYCAASLASGFAAGTKYYLVSLLLFVPIYGLIGLRGSAPSSRRCPHRVVGRIAVGLFLAAAGFVWSTPDVLNGSIFWDGLVRMGAKPYAETAGILGEAYGNKLAQYVNNCRVLKSFAVSLGWGWLILSVCGLVFLRGRRCRAHWPVTVLFPLMFLLYCVFASPWIRSQECMNFLPVLCVTATLAPLALWQVKMPWIRALARVGDMVFAFLALFHTAARGVAVGGLFGWTDTRVVAAEWLGRHGAHRMSACSEIYTAPAGHVFGSNQNIQKVEKTGLPGLRKAGCGYALRNADAAGRGTLDPRTGKRFPNYGRLYDEFTDNTERLCLWAPIESAVAATFCAPQIQLYGLRSFGHTTDLHIELPRPLWTSDSGRETFMPVGHGLGSAVGIRINRFGREIAIGGPAERGGPVYVILNTRERPAEVRLKGFGRGSNVKLDAYDLAVVPLVRPRWKPRFGKYDTVSISTKPVKHTTYIPCFLRVAFSLEEAAGMCAQLGFGRPLPSVFSSAENTQPAGTAARYVLAVNSGDWTTADRLQTAALGELREIGKLIESRSSAFRINGISSFYYDEFARVVLQVPDEINVLAVKTEPRQEGNHSRVPARHEGTLQLPVMLARGQYRLDFEIRALEGENTAADGQDISWKVRHGNTVSASGTCGSRPGDGFVPLSAVVTAGHEAPLSLSLSCPGPMLVEYRNLELR